MRQILRDAATSDVNTGATPNALWGFGKLDVLDALEGAALLNCGVGVANLVLDNDTVTEPRVEQACHSIATGPSFLVQSGGLLTAQAPRVILGNGTSIEGELLVDSQRP